MNPLLEVEGLTVQYGQAVKACVDVSFTLERGEILGVAGESGSGKSTLITALTRLQRPPARTTAGRVIHHPRGGEPVDLVPLSERELRRYRWTSLSIVLQSAMDALNPLMRVGDQFTDALRGMRKEAARERAKELLTMVGIPAERVRAYPHEMSGGMRQRASIALALACEPDLVVMDEPTTAVDVVMQRLILQQIVRLRQELGFAVIFVTHDLPLLLEVADRIAVMYGGRIVEIGDATGIYHDPLHPYTRGLRDSFPPLRAARERLHGIPGSPPDLRHPPPGCAFHPRCDRRLSLCEESRPELRAVDGRTVACHLTGAAR
ncbi:ABC transporter ATP-binding protein [Nonomuraea sp. NPDC050556]|uniref:ABC transporter ATP-binding protein n=1 Tax=Nonomuraea sp. NPDC050556 TaxID=3364369 RepID=UPI0037BAD8A9